MELNILIKREVGDTFDLNKAINDKNYFKPRAEIIESLKIKVKQLENKIQIFQKIKYFAKFYCPEIIPQVL